MLCFANTQQNEICVQQILISDLASDLSDHSSQSTKSSYPLRCKHVSYRDTLCPNVRCNSVRDISSFHSDLLQTNLCISTETSETSLLANTK